MHLLRDSSTARGDEGNDKSLVDAELKNLYKFSYVDVAVKFSSQMLRCGNYTAVCYLDSTEQQQVIRYHAVEFPILDRGVFPGGGS